MHPRQLRVVLLHERDREQVELVRVGPLPELLYYCAAASFQAKKLDQAKEYVDRALAIDDPEFEKTAEFQKLVELKARLDLGPSTDDIWQEILEGLPKGRLERTCVMKTGSGTVTQIAEITIAPDRKSILRRQWIPSERKNLFEITAGDAGE